MAAPCFRGISVARKRVTFVTEELGGGFEASRLLMAGRPSLSKGKARAR
jgi:hypothetical protein